MTATIDYTSQQEPHGASPDLFQLAGIGMDTATLVRMIQSRNERGFHLLYDKYCGALYGILIKFVQRTDVADDLLQDVFVKIWKYVDAFDPARGTLFTWMLNIARNQAIDYLRSSSHQKQSLHVNNDSFFIDTDGSDATASNTSNMAEFKDLKNKAMQLDSKYAVVIDMIFFYGYTQKQTARMLKLPLGTVKTRSRKGLGILKNLYQQ